MQPCFRRLVLLSTLIAGHPSSNLKANGQSRFEGRIFSTLQLAEGSWKSRDAECGSVPEFRLSLEPGKSANSAAAQSRITSAASSKEKLPGRRRDLPRLKA